MKKIIMLFVAVCFLFACAVTPVVEDNSIDLPPVLQDMENRVNTNPNSPSIKIIDYRMDKYTIWAWVDNKSIPGDCDYVVVGEITPNGIQPITVINKRMTPNPCEDAYDSYKEYEAAMKEADANPPRPKNAI